MNSNDASGSSSPISTPSSTNVTTDEIEEYFPQCNDVMKPKVNQTFITMDEAVKFYKEYATLCGFGTRLGSSKRARGTVVDYTSRRVICSREGVREPIENKKTERVRPITRVGCKAMVFIRKHEDGTYKFTVFKEGHNHILASPNSMMFMKENRILSSVQKTFIVKASRLKLGPRKAFRGWKELAGGYHNVGATEVDFKNFVRDIKTYIGDFDGQMFIENFSRKKEICNTFFFDFEVDENKRLCRVFWADTVCRKNNAFFNDMISIDSTFSTNKYMMVFVPFTGVDNHKRCVILGAGLIAHEDVASYVWLFKTFLEAMGDCHPKVIISDQCPAMKIAIAEVFPNTAHRLCMWHIMKKMREKVSSNLWQNDKFKKRFNACVWNNCLDREEFEREWENVITDFKLEKHEWFIHLKDMREDWIPAYFLDIFMGGLMRVTSRSESENSFFDRFVTRDVTLVEFWMCFESAMDAQRYHQSKLDTENKHSTLPLKTPLDLEKHASEIYTHAIFKDFQDELYAALYHCSMEDLRKSEDSEVYTICDSEQNSKNWEVVYKPIAEELTCNCYLFQRMGLLCRHSIWVLKTKNKKNIPEKYIVNRWTKNALSMPVFDKHGNVIGVDVFRIDDQKRLTTEVWQETYSCASLALENDEDAQMLIDKLRELKLVLLERRRNYPTSSKKLTEMERYVGCSIPKEINIYTPKRSKNKGSGKRIESSVLNALEKLQKKQRVCSKCNRKGHNSRTCVQDVEEEEEESDEDGD